MRCHLAISWLNLQCKIEMQHTWAISPDMPASESLPCLPLCMLFQRYLRKFPCDANTLHFTLAASQNPFLTAKLPRPCTVGFKHSSGKCALENSDPFASVSMEALSLFVQGMCLDNAHHLFDNRTSQGKSMTMA